ncbi:MAG TPA: carotenoid oxygenase family protein [Ilumatobacteraceae bacterium]
MIHDLTVHGELPAALSGRLLSIGPASSGGADTSVIHCVQLDAGRAVSYESRSVITDDVAASNLIVFGGSVLALGDGSPAYEVSFDLATVRRVDLAGQSRNLRADATRDPLTGDVHVLADAADGRQAHVVVSAGAFTRTSREICHAGAAIKELAITPDCAVFVADGFVGVAPRSGNSDIVWIATGVSAPALVHADDADDAVVVYAVTPALEKWMVSLSPTRLHREVLDPRPRHFAHATDRTLERRPRYLWSTGDGSVDMHDLVTGRRSNHDFESGSHPGDLVFVADSDRAGDEDGGWLVGVVYHVSGDVTDVVVLDAADIAHTALATIRIPRHTPRMLRSTWVPNPERSHEGDRA